MRNEHWITTSEEAQQGEFNGGSGKGKTKLGKKMMLLLISAPSLGADAQKNQPGEIGRYEREEDVAKGSMIPMKDLRSLAGQA